MGTTFSRMPQVRDLHYLGGHPAAPHELDHIDVTFDASGVRYARRDHLLGTIAWAALVDIGADAVTTTSRMTVPRVWLLGVFAALFKKRDRSVLLRVQDRRGAWLFAVEGITRNDLRLGLDTIRANYAARGRPVLHRTAGASE
jgi:hypothetical protein